MSDVKFLDLKLKETKYYCIKYRNYIIHLNMNLFCYLFNSNIQTIETYFLNYITA